MGTYVIDPRTRRILLSPEMARLLRVDGQPLEMPLEEYRARFYHPEDRAEGEASADQRYAARQPLIVEARVIRGDGAVIWARASSSFERDETGQPVIVGVFQDITDARLANALLVEQREQISRVSERLRLATTSAGLGIWEWDRATDRVILDETVARQHGLRLEDFDGKSATWFRTLLPADAARMKARVGQAISQLDVFEEEASARWPDGSVHVLRSRGRVLRNERGHATGIIGVCSDVTDRHRADRVIQESEERFRVLFERAPVAISVSRGGVTVFVNQKYADLYRLRTRTDVVGRSIGEQWAPESRSEVLARARLRAQGAPVPSSYEGQALRADGTTFLVRVQVELIELPDGPANVAFLTDITEQRRTEDAVRDREARFRSYFTSPLVGMAITSPDKGFLEVNDRFCELLGYTRDELAELDWPSLTHPDDLAGDVREFNRLVAGEVQYYSVEKRFLRKDGGVVWSIISVGAVRKADGTIDYVCGMLMDISARHEAEQRIAYLNRVYATLSGINELIVRERNRQSLLEGVCRIAVEKGRFRMAWIGMIDEASGGLVPVASAGTVDGYLDGLVISSSPDDAAGPAQRCIATGTHAVCNDIAHDPGYAPWRARALQRGYRASAGLPLKQGGRVVGVLSLYSGESGPFEPEEMALLDELAMDVGFALDVGTREAERLSIQTALSESEQRFRQIAENIDEVFWMIDPIRGQTLYVSPGFEKIWGRSRESVFASMDSWFAAVHPEDRERVAHALQTKVTSGEYNETYRILRPDAEVRWIHDRAFPLQDPTGTVYRIVGTASDITERRNIELQLLQSQKMEAIGVLAGGVAHDFNNLLAVILSYSALLVDETKPGDPMRADLAEIKSAASRAAELTRQLLAFSRRQHLQPRHVDLNEIVAGIDRMLRRLLGEDVRLVTIPFSERASLHVDPGQIEQVLMNLAVNARDAMPRGGALTIEIGREELDATLAAQRGLKAGSYVLLAVSDTGEGMDRETQARIFEPFFTTKPVGKGTGLGLSTVFGIVRQSGGQIAVQSARGEGTTFRIWLPLVDQGPAASETRGEADEDLRGTETILVVEDDERVRKLARIILSKKGYHVVEAQSGGDALIASEQHPGRLDLVLTDVVMPLMSGDELVSRLLMSRPELRVVYMSGYPERAAAGDVIAKSGSFIEKPFTPERLLRGIRDALSQRRE